eukprot:scaffold8644_cov115-Isochrysis_galbana.AAC.4
MRLTPLFCARPASSHLIFPATRPVNDRGGAERLRYVMLRSVVRQQSCLGFGWTRGGSGAHRGEVGGGG